eukprot:Skav215597  [mRNA]  locus=scaffold666:302388:304091:+ [translate_table: standard]
MFQAYEDAPSGCQKLEGGTASPLSTAVLAASGVMAGMAGPHTREMLTLLWIDLFVMIMRSSQAVALVAANADIFSCTIQWHHGGKPSRNDGGRVERPHRHLFQAGGDMFFVQKVELVMSDVTQAC